MHDVLNYFRLLIFIVGILLGLGMGRNDESKSENNIVNPSNAEGDLTPGHAKVPGVVINYSPASTREFIGSPSIAVLPNGHYVASHDFFYPRERMTRTKRTTIVVYGSEDRGETWKQLSRFKGQFWSTLFVYEEALYLFGASREYGYVVIQKSENGGKTWTKPKDGKSGLIKDDAKHQSTPFPPVIHDGRIWKAFEQVGDIKMSRKDIFDNKGDWRSFVMSAPVDANLLNAENWRVSELLHHEQPNFMWLEGNIVVTPEGRLINILRMNDLKWASYDKAAVVHVSDDGMELSFDPETDIINFPGGGAKFTLHYDEKSNRYWSIGNKQTNPKARRNVLVLTSSSDLKNWKIEKTLLQHHDEEKHAWQYVDWLFDGDDIIAVSRTAYDDGLGGAYNHHDANYLTFHRIKNFRENE